MSKETILEQFKLLSHGNDGIGAWIKADRHDIIFERLDQLSTNPLSKVQLNQLLAFGKEAPVSDGFFQYYWQEAPSTHPYPVRKLPGFAQASPGKQFIISIDHLKWGLYRLFVDSLLYFGNVRQGYRELRNQRHEELVEYFKSMRFDSDFIMKRGPALKLHLIPKDKRYLISETACKTYGSNPLDAGGLKDLLIANYQAYKATTGKIVSIRKLLQGDFAKSNTDQTLFALDGVLDQDVASEQELEEKYTAIATDFIDARDRASKNTQLFLSMVNDLDVYVATSMRTRDQFREVADMCEKVFTSAVLKPYSLRYFDPTVSAASGHEDKGLIECLMVKCAKILIYCAGDRDSYGKDAEAAMALSLGKPVIFLCDKKAKKDFFNDIHPLSRLIDFKTGIAVGAMVADSQEIVIDLIDRLISNQMEYEIIHDKQDYIKLKEKLTGSVVRLQTNDALLAETFWNHYHGPK